MTAISSSDSGGSHVPRSIWIGIALLTVLALPPMRSGMEVSMAIHMFVQYPALGLAGVLLADGLPRGWQLRLDAWNAFGISGLLFTALALALAMIPRLLDLVLADPLLDALKFAVLVLCGVVLALSWRRAGFIVQGFFLGNVLPMTGVVGVLYMDAPLRLCNAYRLDEQQQVGVALVTLAWAIAIAWLARAGWAVYRREVMAGHGEV